MNYKTSFLWLRLHLSRLRFCIVAIIFFLVPGVTAQSNPDSSKVTDIWVVFRTHFDLGFTDLPENVFKRYREEMMDNALMLIENNEKQPKEKHFSWNVAGWPLEAQMLGPLQTPERKLRIEKAIKEGSLVADGLPFTMQTESLDIEDLVRGLGFSSAISRKYNVPLAISAKMADVPSHSWILPTSLKNAGIQFLQLGCNSASQYPRVPELFWWEGPDGSKILCNYTRFYGSGIKPPSDWPARNYLAMQMTNDNQGPPTTQEIDKLLAYAAKELPGIKIHFATLDDFAKAVLAEKLDLPIVKGDCPDTWIQGLQSNPEETKIARNVRPLETALDGLHTQMKSWGIAVAPVASKLAIAYEQSLLYGEHTWGMNAEYGSRYSYGYEWKKWIAEAAAEPLPPNGNYAALKNSDAHHPEVGSKRKWLYSYDVKRQYIRNTNEIVSSELAENLDLLAASINKQLKRLVVYNPLPWKRSGMIENPWDKGKYFYVNEVPASGYKSFSFNELNEGNVTKDESTTLSTPYFKVVFDLKKGGIISLIEKSTGRELVDQSSKYVIGQFLHERFSSNEVDKWFNAYSRIKEGWGLNDLGKPGMPNATESPYMAFTPTAWKINVTHTAIEDVAVLTSDSTDGFAKGYTLTFTFPRDAIYVDIKWAVESKTAEKIPEGGWLCFPFNIKKPSFTLGRLGGPVNPVKDIVPGTNRYLMAVATGAAITEPDKSGMALTSADAPLLSLGEPGLWKFSLDYVPHIPSVFVNLYNNMWNTNYPLWQDGSWTESVRIWPINKGSQTIANLNQYGWETRLPLLTGIAEANPGNLPVTKTGLSVSRAGVLVTAYGKNPDGDGTILRLWEQSGVSGNCTVKLGLGNHVKAVVPIDLRGNITGKKISVNKGAFSFYLGKYAPASFLLVY